MQRSSRRQCIEITTRKKLPRKREISSAEMEFQEEGEGYNWMKNWYKPIGIKPLRFIKISSE